MVSYFDSHKSISKVRQYALINMFLKKEYLQREKIPAMNVSPFLGKTNCKITVNNETPRALREYQNDCPTLTTSRDRRGFLDNRVGALPCKQAQNDDVFDSE